MPATSLLTLLHIAATEPDRELVDALSASGVRVVEAPAAIDALRSWLAEHSGDEVTAALIEANDTAALPIARAIHAARPEAQIVFLTNEENDARLRRELFLAPRIGRHWILVPGSGSAAADTIRQSIAGAERRRSLRTTINRINVRLASPPDQPARSRIVNDHFVAAVFGQITDGVVMLDHSLRVVMANDAAVRIFGELNPGAELAPLLGESTAVLSERIVQGGAVDMQLTLSRQHATTPLEIRFTRVLDDHGQPLGTAVVVRDITERKHHQARAQLLAEVLAALSSTLRIETALQRLADLIVRWFADVCVIDIVEGDSLTRIAVAAANDDDRPIAEQLRRFPPGQRPRHPAQDALRRPVVRFQNELKIDDWRSLTASEEHLEVVRKLRMHAYLAVPLLTPQRPVGAMTLVRGRSPQPYSQDDAQLLQEVAQFTATAVQNAWLYETAEAANRSKDEFLATLSHELRTPMTSVLGWVQILRLGGLRPEELDEAVSAIETSARAQAQLIDDLLDLSRVQMGKLQLQLDEIDFASVLAAAVETVRPAATAKGLTLETALGALPRIDADPNRLQQVFWNLLSNAIKFTERGGRVVVAAELHEGNVHVRVTDTGRGIAPEFLPVMFERFRQADSATTRRYGGLGLGLAIVKQIVEMHGGTVTASSPGVGHGSTFTVLLPVNASSASAANDDSADREPPPVRLRDTSIVMMESEPGSTVAVARHLTVAGATVRTFASVRATLSGLRDAIPDLLISFTEGADETAITLIREVRTTLRLSSEQLPALALTARRDMQTRVGVLGAGFQRHLSKPFDAQQLVDTITQLLKK